MAIQTQVILNEILIRMNAEGFQGAHVVDLVVVSDGGKTLSESTLPPRPVTAAEVGKLTGTQSAKLIEAADAARSKAAATEADAASKIEDALQQASERIAAAETVAAEKINAAREEAKAKVDEAEAKAGGALEAQRAAEGQLASLTAEVEQFRARDDVLADLERRLSAFEATAAPPA